MMRVNVGKVKATKIGQWGLGAVVLNRLVRMVHGKKTSGECAILSFNTTTGEVMAAVENIPLRGGVINRDFGWVTTFKATLKRVGMTQKDWPYLGTPFEIEEWLLKQAAAKSKASLLALNVRMLGRCVSERGVGRLEYALDRPITEITIGHMIVLEPSAWTVEYIPWTGNSSYPHPRGNISNGVREMRKKLVSLGLGYDDGPFFQEGSRRQEVEKLCNELKVSKKLAGKFLDYAKKNGWGPRIEQ